MKESLFVLVLRTWQALLIYKYNETGAWKEFDIKSETTCIDAEERKNTAWYCYYKAKAKQQLKGKWM